MTAKKYTTNKHLCQYIIEKYNAKAVETKIYGSKYVSGLIIGNYYYPLYRKMNDKKQPLNYKYFLPINAENITYAFVANDILTIRGKHNKHAINIDLQTNYEVFPYDIDDKISKAPYNKFLIKLLLESKKNRLIFPHESKASGILINNTYYVFEVYEISKLSSIHITINLKEVFPKLAIKRFHSITIIDYIRNINELNIICRYINTDNIFDSMINKINYNFQTNK